MVHKEDYFTVALHPLEVMVLVGDPSVEDSCCHLAFLVTIVLYP